MPKKSALTLLPLVLAACMEQGGLTDPAITPGFAASAGTTSTSVPIDLAVYGELGRDLHGHKHFRVIGQARATTFWCMRTSI